MRRCHPARKASTARLDSCAKSMNAGLTALSPTPGAHSDSARLQPSELLPDLGELRGPRRPVHAALLPEGSGCEVRKRGSARDTASPLDCRGTLGRVRHAVPCLLTDRKNGHGPDMFRSPGGSSGSAGSPERRHRSVDQETDRRQFLVVSLRERHTRRGASV